MSENSKVAKAAKAPKIPKEPKKSIYSCTLEESTIFNNGAFEGNSIEKSCMITGHREFDLAKIEYIKSEIRGEILIALTNGYTHFISGFAEGVDLIFASIVAEYKEDMHNITLEAAIPSPNRMDTPNREFKRLIKCCDIVRVHSKVYNPRCYIERNRFMVLNSKRVISVYDGRKGGGTAATLKFAHEHEREFVNIPI